MPGHQGCKTLDLLVFDWAHRGAYHLTKMGQYIGGTPGDLALPVPENAARDQYVMSCRTFPSRKAL